jgi:hypothetical protein
VTGPGERLEDDWDAAVSKVREWTHRTSAAQAAAAVTINTRTPGGPVSLLDEIENDIHAVAAKFQAVDKAAVGALDAIKANPVTYSIYVSLANSAHVPDPGGILGSIDNLLKAFAGSAAPAEPSFTPAGPQVAGQA